MRERFRVYGHDQLRRVVRCTAAALLSIAPLALPSLLPTQLGAEPLSSEFNGVTSTGDAPVKLQLSTGVPESTTSPVLKRDTAKLTWHPTGSADVQDSYDARISQSNEVDSNGLLSGEIILEGNAITGPEFGVDRLPDGDYFWQVRSCSLSGICSKWSEPFPVTIDGIAPDLPTADVTSGAYSRSITISGASEAGAMISTSIDDAACDTTADPNGLWSCRYETPFEYGEYIASVTSTDGVGNISQVRTIDVAVKELFMATQIVQEELPEALNIIPVSDTPENTVFKQPIGVVDIPNSAMTMQASEVAENAVTPALTTEGGIIQSSENGWQVVGLPWFLWLGGIGGILAGWRAFGNPLASGLCSLFSL